MDKNEKPRIKNRVKILSFISVTIMILTGLSLLTYKTVSANNKDGKTFESWVIKCPTSEEKDKKQKNNVCFVMQHLIVKETNQTLLNVAIGHLGEKKELIGVVTLPLGISLAQPIPFAIDENEKFNVLVETCVPNGCKAAFPISDNLLKSFKTGKNLVITLVQSDNRQGYNITLPLKGFAEGFEALKH